MNCESWLEPKKLWITAEMVRALMRSYGVTCSASCSDMRSRMMRAMRASPMLNWLARSSPTDAHAAVAEVVDVVGGDHDLLVVETETEPDQILDDGDEVLAAESGQVHRRHRRPRRLRRAALPSRMSWRSFWFSL